MIFRPHVIHEILSLSLLANTFGHSQNIYSCNYPVCVRWRQHSFKNYSCALRVLDNIRKKKRLRFERYRNRIPQAPCSWQRLLGQLITQQCPIHNHQEILLLGTMESELKMVPSTSLCLVHTTNHSPIHVTNKKPTTILASHTNIKT